MSRRQCGTAPPDRHLLAWCDWRATLPNKTVRRKEKHWSSHKTRRWSVS